MIDQLEILSNCKPDTLYINPTKNGVFATLLDENETLLFELEATQRTRLIVSAFYVNEKKDFASFKLRKIVHKRGNWEVDGEFSLSDFQLSKLKEFTSLLSSLDLNDAHKTKISIGDVHIDALDTILRTDRGIELLKKIAESPELSEDIFALAHKKSKLEEFRKLLYEYARYRESYLSNNKLNSLGEEEIWQHFFEHNTWIFGHGLNYVFLHKVDRKLESTTTGHAHNICGNRVDGLMRSKAIISQYVLIEIKKPTSDLVESTEYRSGTWAASRDLTRALAQIQKSVHDFTCNVASKVQVKDQEGYLTGDEIYRIQPKSYLIIGNLSQLKDHEDKFICFELNRRKLHDTEIVTYDELYERAKCIVETLSKPEIT